MAALMMAPAACRDGEPRAERPGPETSRAERPGPETSRAEGRASGQSPAEDAATGAGNPACDLLTDDDLRAAVGAAVSSTIPADTGAGGLPGKTCIYIFEGPTNQALLVSMSDSPEAGSVFDQVRSQAGESARPVPGIEDAVVVSQEAYLRKGSVLVSVTLSLDQDGPRTAETAARLVEALARRV